MKITDLPEIQAEAIETAKIPIAAFNQSEWVNKYLTPDILWTKFFESKVNALVKSARSNYYFGTGSSESGEGSSEGSGSS